MEFDSAIFLPSKTLSRTACHADPTMDGGPPGLVLLLTRFGKRIRLAGCKAAEEVIRRQRRRHGEAVWHFPG